MAGTFTAQNKVRPSAYMVFKAAHKSTLTPGERGIVALPMKLSWGPMGKVIRLTSNDVVRGIAFEKIGLKPTDEAIKPLMAALQNCPTALVYRMGTNAEVATVEVVDGITATATQPGTLGNSITVTILDKEDFKYEVVTTVRGLELDRQTLTVVEEFVPNDWITLTGKSTYTFAPVTPLPEGVSRLSVAGVEDVGAVKLQHVTANGKHSLIVRTSTRALTQEWLDADWTGSVNYSQAGVGFAFDTTTAENYATPQELGAITAKGLASVAGVALEGGTDGTMDDANDYPAFQNAIQPLTWQCMAAPTTSKEVAPLVAMYIESLRASGKQVQAVVYDYPDADYEGIISMTQGYMIADEAYPVEAAICWMAGATAGAALDESNTYKIVKGATEIIGEMTNAEIEDALVNGQLILSKRQDGSIVIEKDINTLHTFTEDRTYAFSKNRVIRCLDDIATQITQTFENSYIGKVDNNDNGRTLFKGDVIGYINTLQGMGAIQNFDPATDIEVLPGNDIDSVVCNLWIQPLDAMEKLYMTVTVA